MQEMKNVPIPVGPCSTCFKERLQGDRETGTLVVYCADRECGGIYNAKTNRWRLITPISGKGFEQCVAQCCDLMETVYNETVKPAPNVH